MPNTLFLRLEGPLQAWGERARWSVRDTSPEPTKSGVVGLLACALGLNTDQALRDLSSQIRIGVRCDRPGTILRDYHTVVGGVMSAERRIKVNATTHEPETVVSERYYLSDASFLAVVRAEPALIDHLALALQNPVWPVYLGRRSCPPARPIFERSGDYRTLEDALRALPMPSGAMVGDKTTLIRVVLECLPDEDGAVRRRDEINSRSRRTFFPRYSRDTLLSIAMEEREA